MYSGNYNRKLLEIDKHYSLELCFSVEIITVYLGVDSRAGGSARQRLDAVLVGQNDLSHVEPDRWIG